MTIAFMGLGCFLLWMSFRRKEMLMTFCASLTWLGLAMWIFFADEPLFSMSETHAQLLVWVFAMLTFVPWLAQMNTEIQREAKGKRWTTYGSEPKEDVESGYDRYKKQLHNRTRK